MNYRDDHLEDFDSKMGDIEKGSRAATQSSESTRQLSQVEEGIKRGIMNAQLDHQNNTSSRSPGQFLAMLQGGGYSVTTGQMNEFGDDVLDTFTFDGSTITSANDITHKKFQKQQQQVVQFPNQDDDDANDQYPPIKAAGSRATESTYSSEKGSRRSEYSLAENICCGLGRLGIVLLFVAMTSVAVAFILWLTLEYLPKQNGSSPSSACCKGSFEPDWNGREICNAADICCVVCASTIVENGDNVVQEVSQPETELPQTEKPKPKPKPTPAATTAAPSPAPTEPEEDETALPLTCCLDSWQVWGDYEGRPRCRGDDPQDCCQVCGSAATVTPLEGDENGNSDGQGNPNTDVPTPPPTDAPTPSPSEETNTVSTSSPTDVPTTTPAPSNQSTPLSASNATTSNPALECCMNSWDVFGDYEGRERCSLDYEVKICCRVCV